MAESIIETIRGPLLILDRELRIEVANRSFCRVFRVTKAETEGQLLLEFGGGQWDIPPLRRLLEEILPEHPLVEDVELEHVFPKVGKRIIWLNARRVGQHGGESQSILLAMEDVTERRRAEHEVLGKHVSLIFPPEDIDQQVPQQELAVARQSGRAEEERWHRRNNGEVFWALIRKSEQLRTLWESAEVLLTAPNPQVMMQEIFQKMSKHLAVDAYFNFLVDDSGDHLRLVAYGGVPEGVQVPLERLEFGEAICGTVALRREPMIATDVQQSDDPRAALVKSFGIRTYVCHPLIFEDQLIGTLSFASRRVDRFGEEDLAFLKTLSHYVTVAHLRLRLVDELQNAHRRKDEFLAMLAHELRNPLAPIRSGLDLLAMEGTAHSRTVAMMQAQVVHVVRLVDDLLDVSRIMRERIELRKQPVELASLIEQSVEAIRSAVDAEQQELLVAVPQEPIWIDADAVRVVQVIENLLNNASKYTGTGGRIELTAERHDAMASIIVRDTGCGMDAELLPNVFELFTQSDRSLDRARGGLGIGLTLVKRLVEMHQGTVSAHSDGPGLGSRFVVQFPTTTASPGTLDVMEPRTAVANCCIGIVDDNEAAAWMVSMLLKKFGEHQIWMAHDGPAALEKIKDTRPDLVFLDIGLPRMDGYEVAKAVRKMPGCDHVLLVALTGYGQEEDRKESKAAGFDEHLTKPPSVDQLRAVLGHPKLNKRLPR